MTTISLTPLAALATLAAFAALLAAPALAAPLDPRQLPADTKWFVHVDFDAARSSRVGAALRDAWLAQPGTREGLGSFQSVTGTDALNDLHGLTVFNTSYEPDAGVVLVHGKVDRERLGRLVASLPDHAAAVRGHDRIHTWIDANSHRKVAGTVRGEDTVILSQSESAVADELDVLDGKRETFASNTSKDAAAGAPAKALAKAPAAASWSWAPGTIVSAAASGLSDAKDLPIRSPVLRQCAELAIEAGEHDGRSFVHAKLLTRSPDVAAQVRSLVEGLKALVQLQSAQDPGVARALVPMKVAADGAAVRIDWETPAAEVVKAIREQAAKSGHPVPTAEPVGTTAAETAPATPKTAFDAASPPKPAR